MQAFNFNDLCQLRPAPRTVKGNAWRPSRSKLSNYSSTWDDAFCFYRGVLTAPLRLQSKQVMKAGAAA